MKKLRRSKKEKMVAGVCGGLAEYFDMDPTIMRLLYILLSVCSAAFPGLLVYFIIWIVVPYVENDDTEVIT